MTREVWSDASLAVLGAFQRGRKLHGLAVVRETRLGVSTVYPILRRLTALAFLKCEIERVDPTIAARVPRTIYEITEDGLRRKRRLRRLLA